MQTSFDVLDACPVPILVLKQGMVQFVNREALAILGTADRQEVLGMECVDFVHPEDLQKVQTWLASTLQSASRLRARLLRMDGRPIQAEMKASSFEDQSELAVQIAIVYSSMNKIAVTDAGDIYRELYENANDLIYTHDMEGHFTSINRAVERVFGIPPEAALQMNMRDVVSPEYLTTVHKMMEQKVAENIPTRYEIEIVTPAGVRIPIEVSSRIITLNGRPVGVQGIARDITERKRAEALQKIAHDAALESVRLKSQFLANMSHEIRTPLNGVIGMTHLLLGTDLTAKQMDFVETIQNSGETLLKIINEILDLSKIEAGKMTLENIELNLEVLVDQVITMFAERAHSKGLELVTHIQKNVPKTLLGDPVRIRQIITNLVANGIKFTDKGMVTLQISLLHEENETATVQFKITDTGIGIPTDLQSRLFRPFSQADGSTTRRYGGTGLGLAICKQLTELMGGEIDVESYPGQGSTFRFSIPLARPQKKEEARQSDPDGLKKLRVLLVDNNAANRDLLQQQLTEWEMTTDVAETGLQALEHLRNAVHRAKPFDLVIEDMLLPGMDGMELARAIKSDPLIAQTKLVMLTSFAMRGHGDEARQSGIAAYLTKPVRQTHLRNCLLQVMHRTDQAGPQPLITRYTLASSSSLLSVPQLPQMRVLLVEDIEANQVVARLILENLHCRVDVASNGLKALGMLAENSYDLVFMDCQMPLMDGFETTAVIREQEEQSGKHIIIVALTAGAMEGDRERCLQVGMDDYISKPFRPEDFERALQRWVVGAESAVPAPVRTTATLSSESVASPVLDEIEDDVEDDDTPTLTPESGSGLMPVTGHSISPPVLDESTVTQLLELTRQDTGVLYRLMMMSFDTLVPFPDALQKAFARADFEHIGKIAHKLRGTGGSIGAIGIIRIGQALEEIKSSAALADAPFLVAEFRAELTRLKEEVNRRFHP